MLTLREVFDKSKAGMESQGWKQAVSDQGGYAYRNADGMGCAVGVLLPVEVVPSGPTKYGEDHGDGFQQFLIRSKGQDNALTRALAAQGVPLDDKAFDLLTDLQNAHDGGNTPEVMKWLFADVERRYFPQPVVNAADATFTI